MRPVDPAALLIRLALRACESGHPETAAEALRGVLAMGVASPAARASEVAQAPQVAVRAVRVPELARLLGYSVRHVRNLLSKGAIPADAVLGAGRATRVLVDRAIAALAQRDPRRGRSPLEAEAEGAELARRRSALRVVRGEGCSPDRAGRRGR